MDTLRAAQLTFVFFSGGTSDGGSRRRGALEEPGTPHFSTRTWTSRGDCESSGAPMETGGTGQTQIGGNLRPSMSVNKM